MSAETPRSQTRKQVGKVQLALAWMQVAPVALGGVLRAIVILQMNMAHPTIGPQPVGGQGSLNL